MADDRMAIVCKKCKLGIAIAKFWHGGGWRGIVVNEDRANAFFEKHAGCGEQGYGRYQYHLGYEMDGSDWAYEGPLIDEPKDRSKRCRER